MTVLSIIIPVYNEEKNIPVLFGHLAALRQQRIFDRIETIFVTDGSTDTTELILRRYAGSLPEVVVLSYPVNRGKGFAVREGMLAAKGDWRLQADADLSVSLLEIRTMLPSMQAHCDVISGNRKIPHSSIAVSQGVIRRSLGWGFTLLANIILGLSVSDFTCGFKCFSARAAKALFSQSKIDRWAYDAEILFLAKRDQWRICEVPVHWRNGPRSKVRVIRDSMGSFRDLLRIRFLHRRFAHGN